jgi:hypothetical protein
MENKNIAAEIKTMINNIGKFSNLPYIGTYKKYNIKNPTTVIPDYIYSNLIIDKFCKNDRYLNPAEKWGLFTDLFSAFDINPEFFQDYRVSFIINFINKIRNGIKIKTNAIKLNGAKMTPKSKGYNTQMFSKNLETAKDSIQMGYCNAILRNKRLTPMRVILSSLKIMQREKLTNKKWDRVKWNNRLDLVNIEHLDQKLTEIKNRLLSYNPTTKGYEKWYKIWVLFLVDGMSKKAIINDLNISKAGLFKAMSNIPEEFEDIKLQLSLVQKSYSRK